MLSDVKSCPGCGAEQTEGREFCGVCGAALVPGATSVPAALLEGAERKDTRRNPAAVGTVVVVAVALAAGIGLAARPVAGWLEKTSGRQAPLAVVKPPTVFGFGGRLRVGLVTWRETRFRRFEARLRVEQISGLSDTTVSGADFLVFDPRGEPHAPVDEPPPSIDVGKGRPADLVVTYQLPRHHGRYELVWTSAGRRVGAWPVDCYEC